MSCPSDAAKFLLTKPGTSKVNNRENEEEDGYHAVRAVWPKQIVESKCPHDSAAILTCGRWAVNPDFMASQKSSNSPSSEFLRSH